MQMLMSNEKKRTANVRLSAALFPKKSRERIDTVVRDTHTRRAHDVLRDAFNAWTGLDEFRRNAYRNKRYTFGDQWGDAVRVGCETMTERESIVRRGNIPLSNNRIRGIVRSVSGVFQSAQTEPVCIARDRDEQQAGEIMSSAVQYVYQLNRMRGLDSANFQYFLITGVAAFRSAYSYRNGKMDVWADVVNYNRLFFDNHMNDTRHWDCHLIGEIHDAGIYDVVSRFAEGSPQRAGEIRRMYAHQDRGQTVSWLESNLTEDIKRHLDFFIPTDETRCRVIEVWKKEACERLLVHDLLTGDFYKTEPDAKKDLDAENIRRLEEQTAAGVAPENMKLIKYEWFVDNYWYYYFLTPFGEVLQEGETPFWHESHPYSLKIYPFYDGQVFPFVSDFIDQQRYINRLIMLQDFISRSSAKGVLAIDEASIPDGYSIKDFAENWALFDGIVVYTSKSGNARPPQQIVSNSRDMGITEMLSIQLKLLEDISGVQGALQGRTPAAGTPASLYMQQTQNSATSLTEIFEAFRELREERDFKLLKLVQQYYTEPRYLNIVGKSARRQAAVYEPAVVRNAEFDLSIAESTSTPAYRLVMNDFLMQLFGTGQITLTELLENGAFPFADNLLQSVRARQEEMQQEQQSLASGGQPLQSSPAAASLEAMLPEYYRQLNSPSAAAPANTPAR
jgi:hypothetical protein